VKRLPDRTICLGIVRPGRQDLGQDLALARHRDWHTGENEPVVTADSGGENHHHGRAGDACAGEGESWSSLMMLPGAHSCQ
jgi:hypothetical protein